MGKLKTTNEFINDAKIKHGDTYDYSAIIYSNSKIKVEIICEKHGSFFQTPNDHLGGHGCRKCSEINTLNYNIKEGISKNKNLPLSFYILEMYNDYDKFLKIGISKQIDKRIINIKTKSKCNVNVLLQFPCVLKEAVDIEDTILLKFRKDYKKFNTKVFTGYSECLKYECKDLLLEELKTYLNIKLNRSGLVGKILDFEYNKK